MLLGDGNKSGRSINLAGGGVDNPLYPQIPGCLQNIQGAFDIGVHIGVGGVIGVGNAD